MDKQVHNIQNKHTTKSKSEIISLYGKVNKNLECFTECWDKIRFRLNLTACVGRVVTY